MGNAIGWNCPVEMLSRKRRAANPKILTRKCFLLSMTRPYVVANRTTLTLFFAHTTNIYPNCADMIWHIFRAFFVPSAFVTDRIIWVHFRLILLMKTFGKTHSLQGVSQIASQIGLGIGSSQAIKVFTWQILQIMRKGNSETGGILEVGTCTTSYFLIFLLRLFIFSFSI